MEDKILKAIEGLNKRFDIMDNRFDAMDSRFDAMDNRFDSLESQVKENTDILKALEHSAQVNKAEHDKMTMDLAEISGDVKAMRKDISTVEVVTANNWSDIARLKSIK